MREADVRLIEVPCGGARPQAKHEVVAIWADEQHLPAALIVNGDETAQTARARSRDRSDVECKAFRRPQEVAHGSRGGNASLRHADITDRGISHTPWVPRQMHEMRGPNSGVVAR